MVKQLNTISLSELLDSTFTPQIALIDNLLYSGIYLFAGPPKTGKSFFVLQIAHHISTGIPFWGLPTHKKSVVYLALEDTQARLQKRYISMVGIETSTHEDNLSFCTEEIMIADGLVDSIESYINTHNNIGLIIIDTLQKIRDKGAALVSYADDYEVIGRLKKISDKYSVCIILVHHTRKSDATDPFEMISGTNGLLGAADGAFVLLKSKRNNNSAVLNVVGRDQPDLQVKIAFNKNKHIWETLNEDISYDMDESDPILSLINEFLTDEWSGTASELIEKLSLKDIAPNALGRKLNVNVSTLLTKYRIFYTSKRKKERIITLCRIPES